MEQKYLCEVFPKEVLDLIYHKMKVNVGLMGAPGVGKTNLINRILNKPFEKKYIPTEGIQITDSLEFKFFDFAGQEVYGNFDQEIINSLDVCIMLYDVTSKLSKKLIKMWKQKLHPRTVIFTFANKIDLKPHEELKPYMIACKNGINIDVVIDRITYV